MGLYENVKDACLRNNTTILSLEKKLMFPRSSISKWDVNIPSIAKVKKVADELNVTVDDLTKGVIFPEKAV